MIKDRQKLLFGLFLSVFVLAAAGMVSAQVFKPNDCCKARADFKTTSGVDATGNPITITINSGNIIGPPLNKSPYCDVDGDGDDDTTASGITGYTYVATNDWGLVCMLNTIYTVTNWLFYILTVIVVLMFIYGGFTILTAMGSPEKAGKGKGIITYAIIGLAIAALAKIIPSLVKFIMGV